MIFFKFYNSIATTYFCIGLIFISSSTSHALESEKTQTFRTNIDYGEVLKVIRNESAAGVFGRSLFKYPQHTPKSIHLIDIPKEGTGWIKIFERKITA
jgi:hypothetical protein